MKLYSHPLSNNGYKITLLLSFLEQNYELVNVNLVNDDQKTAEFLTMHPLGQVPVLVDGDVTIWDSQAILVYLARKYENWLQLQPEAIAQINSWLSFASKELAIGLASARGHYLFGGKDIKFINRLNIDIEKATLLAHNSLQVLNQHLSNHKWLAGESPSIADIACFPPVVLAGDGKVSLEAYPYIQDWIIRFKALPRFVEM
jgi:glutathione S-transferase